MFGRDGPTLSELAMQALSSTERGYDLLARKFDHTPFRTPDAVLEPMARAAFATHRPRALLDVACGTGAAMLAVHPYVNERLVGVDFSAGMLAVARERLADLRPPPTIELISADARSLPFDAEFDAAVSAGAFGHFVGVDEEALVAGIARALVRGGRFVFVTTPMPSLGSPAYWIARSFNAAMHVRNALLKPEFVMIYLTFTWPEVRPLLERHGLSPSVLPCDFPPPFTRALAICATKAAR